MSQSTTSEHRWIEWVAWIVGAVLVYIAASSVWPDSFLITRLLGAMIFGYLIRPPIAALGRAAWANRYFEDDSTS